MLSVVSGVKSLIQPKLKVSTENLIFILHSKVTAAAFLVCSCIITAKQLLGAPITCLAAGSELDVTVINNYCWIRSTFSVKTSGKQVGHEIPYHGIGSFKQGQDYHVYRAYYQWVPLCLFFQALLYLTPHLIWKSWEGEKIKNLTTGITKSTYIGNTSTTTSKIAEFLTRSFHKNKAYAMRHFICEILNLACDIGNLFLIDTFLGGEFMRYGIDVVAYSEQPDHLRQDPMILLFPRLTKCTFHKFGPSGTLQKIDSLCVLNLNIMNEKIYIFFWFWLIIMTILAGLALVYRIALILSTSFRKLMLEKSKGSLASDVSWEELAKKCDYGDYFLLKNLSTNLNEQTYTELVTDYAERLGCVYPMSLRPRDSSDLHASQP